MWCEIFIWIITSETIQVLADAARTPLTAPPCVEWKVFVIFLVLIFFFFVSLSLAVHFWITKRIWLYNSFVYVICDREWQQWRWRRRTVIRSNDYPNDEGAHISLHWCNCVRIRKFTWTMTVKFKWNCREKKNGTLRALQKWREWDRVAHYKDIVLIDWTNL